MARPDWAWRTCLAVCGALLVLPLWVAPVPPLVDLPQHAANIAISHHWTEGGYQNVYIINYFSNTVIGSELAYLLAFALPAVAAYKLVLSLALLATLAASVRLIDAVGGNRWSVFAMAPAGYGYSMMWGFVHVVIAIPFGLWLVAAAIRYRDAPSRRRAVPLALLAVATFLTHALVAAATGLAALAIVGLGTPRWRDRLVGALALAAVVPVELTWWLGLRLAMPPVGLADQTPFVGDFGPHRIPDLVAAFFGWHTSLPLALAFAIVIASLFLLGKPARAPWRWALVAVALLFYFCLPLNVAGVAFVAPRFAVLIVPGLFVALDRREGGWREGRLWRIPLIAIAAGWLAWVTVRFHAFGVEAQPVLDLIRRAEPHGRLLALVAGPGSRVAEGAPYLHYGMFYEIDRAGVADFSMAEDFPNHFRYRPEAEPALPVHIQWEPQRFRWAEHGGDRYDYFLVRARDPRRFFAGARDPLEVVGRAEGGWWLIHQTRAPR